MNRRKLLTCFVGAAATCVAEHSAATTRKLPTVGVLWHAANAQEEAIYLDYLGHGFSKIGLIEGKTFTLDHRFPAETPELFDKFANELAALPVDVLVAVSQPAAIAAHQATTTIPIVFVLVPDPVGAKLVESISRPNGNITGCTQIATELSAKRLELLKLAFPNIRRAGLLVYADDPQATARYIEENTVAASALGIDVQPVKVRSYEELDEGFNHIAKDHCQAAILTATSFLYQARFKCAELAVRNRLPLMAYSRQTLDAGALMSYGPDYKEIFDNAAVYVDKILKGSKPGQLPVVRPTKFEMLINLKTANQLGIELNADLLTRADEIVE